MKFETVNLNDFLWPSALGQEGRISSRIIAQYFGKDHRKVVRDIEALDIVGDFNTANFGRITYVDSRGRTQDAVALTRQGCFYLIMGYTGSKAAKIKVELLLKFDQMEKQIQEQERRYWKSEYARQANLKEALDVYETGVEVVASDNDLLTTILEFDENVDYNTLHNI